MYGLESHLMFEGSLTIQLSVILDVIFILSFFGYMCVHGPLNLQRNSVHYLAALWAEYGVTNALLHTLLCY